MADGGWRMALDLNSRMLRPRGGRSGPRDRFEDVIDAESA